MIRAFALCKFVGWPVYVFKGTKQALARSTPSSMALNTVGTEKSSFNHGAVTRGLEGNDDIDCRANDVSIKVDSETISTQKKEKFEVITEIKKGKKKGREKMNEKKKRKEKATTTKTTR